MGWLATYRVDTTDDPGDLGAPATLTVILRDLATDHRTHAIIPVDPQPPGDAQREAIQRTMAAHFPDAWPKTYDAGKQVASYLSTTHLHIVIYEEHDVDCAGPDLRPRLFAA